MHSTIWWMLFILHSAILRGKLALAVSRSVPVNVREIHNKQKGTKA